MKTSIIITGQFAGNSTLRNSIMTDNCVEKNLQFNNKELIFNTKKEAVKALSSAFNFLKSDKEDWKNSNASYKYASSLSYDASRAYIN